MLREQGLIHIICGDGKGKTTAAVGLCIRAAGRNQKVLIARFLKNEDSGELNILKQIEPITLIHASKFFGFTWEMSVECKKEATEYYTMIFHTIVEKAVKDEYDLLVLDEIMAAVNYGFVDGNHVMQFLQNKPKKLEVVLTGRNPSKELCEIADYISEIKKVKHPFESGISARVGIEY